MDFQNILALCDAGEWKKADDTLKQWIRAEPDRAEPYTAAAHAALRLGNSGVARWLVHKAQALVPENPQARTEDICIDFYEARYDSAYRKLHAPLLTSAPATHRLHLIAAYLCCLYNDAELYKQVNIQHAGFEEIPALCEDYLSPDIEHQQPAWPAVDKVFYWLKRTDKLSAALAARFAEMFFPAEANSFAALGVFNLNAGFFRNADRNFHEAIFRESSYSDLVYLHKFYLFCRQHRFSEAVRLGLAIEKAGKLDFTGHGLLLEAMLRSGTKADAIRERLRKLEPHLRQKNYMCPLIEVVKLRLLGHTREQLIEGLRAQADHPSCPAACLYFYAELLAPSHLPQAKNYAARALALDSLHPDAARWHDPEKAGQLNFEYAGLFIPKEHEGGAWPTGIQLQLLEILFRTPGDTLAQAWSNFTKNNSLYTLEAGAYRLLPFLYKKLSAALKSKDIAECDLLKGIWKKSYFENALQMRNILHLVQQLEKTGVEVVVLKGLANALSLYGDLGSRPMSDVDFLIAPSQLEQVDRQLKMLGWTCKETPTLQRLRFSYASTYRHPNGSIVDVHWKPCENFSADFYDPQDIGALRHTEFLGHRWNTLSPTLNLLCTILHGVEWNHLSPVRWVADALLILQKFPNEIDWPEMHRLASKYHCLPILATGLQFLAQFDNSFIADLPEALLVAAETDYRNDTLLTIRLRSRNHLASFEEAWAVLSQFKKRYNFTEHDHLFICGGDQPEHFKHECEKHDVAWTPYFDRDLLLAKNSGKKPYNVIVIDANLSCTFQCLNVRLDQQLAA